MTNKETETIAGEEGERNEWWVEIVSRAVIFWVEHMIRTETIDIENLKEAADYVNSEKGGLIVTPNHNSYLDAELIKKVRDIISLKKRFLLLWANKFTGKDGGKYSKTGQEAAKIMTIELIDVPQETTDLAAARKVINLIKNVGKEALENNNILGVFPEGTRSRDGTLHRAKRALRVLFGDPNIDSKTLILPIAATGTGEYLPPDSEKPNPFAKVTIYYGKPYTYAQAQEEMKKYNLPIEDIMMWHIGQLLPIDKWGEYLETFLEIQNFESKSK